MAASIDVLGTEQVQASSGVTSFSYTGLTTTAASQTNGGILVFVEFDAQVETGITCTWDAASANQAMTQIASVLTGPTNTLGRLVCFALLAPASYGALTISLSWTTGAFIAVNAVSFTGVTQSSIAAAFIASTASDPAATTSSIALTGGTGDILIAAHVPGSGSPNINSVSNTSWFTDNSSARLSWGANYTTGVTSATLTGSWSGAYDMAVVGVDVVAAGAGGGGSREAGSLTMMGFG